MNKVSNQIIPIFFTFDRHYVLAACIAFHTMLEKASRQYQYRLYVVHTGLKECHKKRLQKVVRRFSNAELFFKDASGYDTGWEGMQYKGHFSQEIFYKLTAADMFPEYDRILFSDVDVIFTDDIAPSYFLYPGEKFYYAGVSPIFEPKGLQYIRDFTPEEIVTLTTYAISAGYMLINLACLKEDHKQKELTDFFRRNVSRLRLPEQDCIALCCAPHLRFMDFKYVVCAYQFHLAPETVPFNIHRPCLKDHAQAVRIYRRMLDEVVQLHYPTPEKPWNNPFVFEYGKWLKACRRARQTSYYLMMQPAFLIQRIKRYNIKRFISKIKLKIGIHSATNN